MIPLLLVIASAADALTLAWFLAIVPPEAAQAERNPIIVALLAIGGVGLVFLVKAGLSWLVAWRITRAGRPRTRLGRFLLPFALVATVVGLGFNLMAVAIVSAL